jgi:hypothetical protein
VGPLARARTGIFNQEHYDSVSLLALKQFNHFGGVFCVDQGSAKGVRAGKFCYFRKGLNMRARLAGCGHQKEKEL